MGKITYTDKVTMNENPDIPAINKVQATDLNEIKNVVNENYDKFNPVVLYNNTAGSNGTITLSDSAANYEYIEIFYRTNDNDYSSVKVYEPNGKSVCLFAARAATAIPRVYQKVRAVAINGTSIENVSEANYAEYVFNNNNTGPIIATNNIFITRVIGYI